MQVLVLQQLLVVWRFLHAMEWESLPPSSSQRTCVQNWEPLTLKGLFCKTNIACWSKIPSLRAVWNKKPAAVADEEPQDLLTLRNLLPLLT
ncbi:hypothetical protein AV530_001183 [Patagioenas fasciata monilis]|uniref:Secreted protein n=1 Tax=Patagioenas fasciata monilis TaxID=372326 RepID=A0A1V4KTN7_PATFA|nr:hypothetical protein AV530_001183 [Patagioenas fasciata monilis]